MRKHNKSYFYRRLAGYNPEAVSPIIFEASGGFFTSTLIGFCAEKLGFKDQECQIINQKNVWPSKLSITAATAVVVSTWVLDKNS
ncbi:hypothetical protein MHYMCMPASI_00006 [Hyalomma marginatum]|uniref:Uncharacterized protein n=1 Tax=Hyalomma marginatum TaxID=34627 RepID=A0A8S4C3F1_9ACAR|nr:hypothetical protein MHYMCMPASI_00006 [Hyalomma marginatum]